MTRVLASSESPLVSQQVRSAPKGGTSALPSGIGRALAVAAALACTSVTVSDLEAAGTVAGKVYDAKTGNAVSSARVRVDGTNVSTVTETDGTYRLRNVPSGDVRIVVEYGGTTREAVSVEVVDGVESKQNVGLKLRGTDLALDEEEVFTLSEFEVVGLTEFNAHIMAISEERYSTQMKDVVAADTFGDNTDGNLGEFVKFLPGLLVEYGAGDYGNGADAGAVGIRGFGAEQTSIMIDGMPISGATPGSLTRAVGLDMISVNNASRIEVSKIASADMPDGAVGGSINLISRTAFEYPKPQFNWRAYLSMNSENMDSKSLFGKTPGPTNKETSKSQPGFDFSYIKPINEKFGFSVNGQYSRQFNENQRAQGRYSYNSSVVNPVTGLRNDVTNPFLDRISITDAPRLSERTSFGAKLDWRPAEGHSMSLSLNRSEFSGTDSNRRVQIEPRNLANWGDNGDGSSFVESATNQGRVAMNVDFLDREGSSIGANFKYDFTRGPWDIDFAASTSNSRASLESTKNGHFSVIELTSANVGNVSLYDIRDGVPGDIQILNRSGEAFDLNDITNFTVNNLSSLADGGSGLFVNAGQTENQTIKNVYKVDVKRELDFISSDAIRLTAKVGLYREEVEEKKSGRGTNYRYRYIGPVSAFDPAVYGDDVYVDQDLGFGLGSIAWVDPYKIYSFYQANPEYFSDTEDRFANTQSVAARNYNEYVTNQKDVTETKDSYYAMLTGKMLNGKLSFETGVRGSKSSVVGRDRFEDSKWNLFKKADGKIWFYHVRDNNGNPIFDTEDDGSIVPRMAALNITQDNTNRAQYIRDAAAADGIDLTYRVNGNSLEAAQLRYQPLYPVSSKVTAEPAYSFSAAYEITSKLTGRFGYGRSNGSPNYEGEDGLLQRVQYNEDSDGGGGKIVVGNPNLKPWVADSFDYQLAYYTDLGGKIKFSFFTKDVENYSETDSIAVTSLDVLRAFSLNEDLYYVDSNWVVETKVNGIGTSRTKGYEFEINQSLGFLGDFGNKFNVYGSFTTKKVNQQNTSRVQQTPDDLAGAGISFLSGKLRADVRATFRSEQYESSGTARVLTDKTDRNSFRRYPTDHPDYDPASPNKEWTDRLFTYTPSEVKVDVNVNYQLTDRYGLFFVGRNVTNTATKSAIVSEGDFFPDYVYYVDQRNFGFNMQLGVRGSF